MTFISRHMPLLILLLTPLIVTAWASPSRAMHDPMETPSLMIQDGTVTRSVLLAVTKAGKRLVAVGERGIILLSDDDGKTWRQTTSPVSVTLTDVYFTTPHKGWAVGHSGVILHSNDGGKTWTKQLDGVKAAQMSLDAARSLVAEKKGNFECINKAVFAAELLVKDGPDKPFLKIFFSDENTGFIIGAYNLIFRTDDGGKTWKAWQYRLENPQSLHLYDMAMQSGALYVVGERGLLLRSTDKGQTFHALRTPYEGSYFGCSALADGAILIYGLRGNAYRSQDGGASWKQVETNTTRTISTARQLGDGRVAVITEVGEVLLSSDMGRSFHPIKVDVPSPFVDLTELGDARLLLVGVRGVTRILLPDNQRS